MARYWIGTSGWNYKHWRSVFYPPKLPVPLWFEFYSRRFQTVEINNTFYREPQPKTYDAWREQAPDGFCYAVKAHQYLTHYKRLLDPAEPLGRVLKGVDRLEDHAGPVLYQMPPAFKRSEQTAERLEEFLHILPPGYSHVMEFRDKSWWDDDSTFEQLRRHNVAFCCHDSRGKETPCLATADFAYIRFHGGDRRSGNYTDAELCCAAEDIEQVAASVSALYIYFNNDGGGHAIANATTLARMLHAKPPAPV